jgi:serine protease Do
MRPLGVMAAVAILAGLPVLADCSPDQGSQAGPVPVERPIIAVTGALSSNEVLVDVAERATASVVNIASSRTVAVGEPFGGPSFGDPSWRRFFGEEFEQRMPQREERVFGQGSGVIVSADGYIMTNNHVVEEAKELTVYLPDKRRLKAKIVGTDPRTDLALIKIDVTGLPTLPWGTSSKLRVGEMVLAIGSPFGLTQTVTMGIISAVGRASLGIVDYEDFIQTDAAINPGNSGGALVNLKGELIGIPSAIFSQSGGYMGIGFAIPTSMAKSVMDSLLKHGKVIRGWTGISIQELTPELANEFRAKGVPGVLVADVMEGGPAAKAKLERGNIITTYDGKPVTNPTQLRMLVAGTAPGTTVTLTVLKEGRAQDVAVTVGELPKELARAGRSGLEGDHALAGITVEPTPTDRSGRKMAGVRVSEVDPESPAAMTGLRPGDIIREINRKPVKSVQDFERLAGQLGPKDQSLLLVTRGNATLFLSISPG